jgi:integrase
VVAREAARARGERFSQRGLSNSSINHTLAHLAQVLEVALEYARDEGWPLTYNAAVGKRRRLAASTPARPWVEPEQLMAFLDASSGVGRVLLVVLAGCGLRIGEALALKWQHVDLGASTLHIVASKTEAGIREVHLTPALKDELAKWSEHASFGGPDVYVIHTLNGGKQSSSNLRRDVLEKAVTEANVTLAELGIAPIGHMTFHGLRRSFASLRCVCGDDPKKTADQLGHTDSRFTMDTYTQASNRRERLAKPQREAFDRAIAWASYTTPKTVQLAAQLAETASP